MDNRTILNYTAKTPTGIPKRRIVQFGANEREVILATGLNQLNCGVTTEVDAAMDERADVVHGGIAYVEAGAAVPLMAWIGPDSQGRATSAGQTWNTVGRALEPATAAGQVIKCFIALGNI